MCRPHAVCCQLCTQRHLPLSCADRKVGAGLRCHAASSMAELHVPYVYPSKPLRVCFFILFCDAQKALGAATPVLARLPSTRLPDPCTCTHAGESGGRADVRWLALAEPAGGAGLLAAAAGQGASFQASRLAGQALFEVLSSAVSLPAVWRSNMPSPAWLPCRPT